MRHQKAWPRSKVAAVSARCEGSRRVRREPQSYQTGLHGTTGRGERGSITRASSLRMTCFEVMPLRPIMGRSAGVAVARWWPRRRNNGVCRHPQPTRPRTWLFQLVSEGRYRRQMRRIRPKRRPNAARCAAARLGCCETADTGRHQSSRSDNDCRLGRHAERCKGWRGRRSGTGTVRMGWREEGTDKGFRGPAQSYNPINVLA